MTIAAARSSDTSTALTLDAATTTSVTVHAASHVPQVPLSAAAATQQDATTIASPRSPRKPTASAMTARALPSATRDPTAMSRATITAIASRPAGSHRDQSGGASAERTHNCICANTTSRSVAAASV